MNMKYLNQVITVTKWEFRRFFKPRNEVLGIVIMLVLSAIFYFGSKYAFSGVDKKLEISVFSDMDVTLTEFLSNNYAINRLIKEQKAEFIGNLKNERDVILLEKDSEKFVLHAYKNTPAVKKLKTHLDEYHKQREMKKIGLSSDELMAVLSRAPVVESFLYTDN